MGLKFTAFDVELHSDCRYDHLVIEDGDGTTLMDMMCGTTLPSDIVSKSNIVKLHFTTDSSTTKSGWSVTWTAKKPGNLEDHFFPLNTYSQPHVIYPFQNLDSTTLYKAFFLILLTVWSLIGVPGVPVRRPVAGEPRRGGERLLSSQCTMGRLVQFLRRRRGATQRCVKVKFSGYRNRMIGNVLLKQIFASMHLQLA